MSFSRRLSALVVALLVTPAVGESQETRFTIDPGSSLAWYQIDPHYSHLWGTTCPDDPNWQAGEGRTPGKNINYGSRKPAKAVYEKDTRIPLYPRLRVFAVCRQAVRGGIVSSDTVTWRGIRGEVVILPDSLETGLDMRSIYLKRTILETGKYEQIRFVLDSLSGVQNARVPGDTIRGTAFGTLEMHGVHARISAPIKAWRVGEALRMQTHFTLPAEDLEKVFRMSKAALAMGTTLGRWDTIHMGVDVILRQ